MSSLPLLGEARGYVVRYLSGGPRTAQEVALTLGIQVSAARKHLDRLRELGLVREEFRREGVGRPRKRYALTDEGMEVLPRRYDAILNELVARLARERGDQYVEGLMTQVATDLAKTIPSMPGWKARWKALVEALNRLGFDARLEERDAEVRVVSRNCPLLRTARAHRELVCSGLHVGFLKAALSVGEVERKEWIVSGDPACVHIIRKEALGKVRRGGPAGLKTGSIPLTRQ